MQSATANLGESPSNPKPLSAEACSGFFTSFEDTWEQFPVKNAEQTLLRAPFRTFFGAARQIGFLAELLR